MWVKKWVQNLIKCCGFFSRYLCLTRFWIFLYFSFIYLTFYIYYFIFIISYSWQTTKYKTIKMDALFLTHMIVHLHQKQTELLNTYFKKYIIATLCVDLCVWKELWQSHCYTSKLTFTDLKACTRKQTYTWRFVPWLL